MSKSPPPPPVNLSLPAAPFNVTGMLTVLALIVSALAPPVREAPSKPEKNVSIPSVPFVPLFVKPKMPLPVSISRSLPLPPCVESAPKPPVIESSLLPPSIVSLPAPPTITSLSSPPCRLSGPAPPVSVSLPPRPTSVTPKVADETPLALSTFPLAPPVRIAFSNVE